MIKIGYKIGVNNTSAHWTKPQQTKPEGNISWRKISCIKVDVCNGRNQPCNRRWGTKLLTLYKKKEYFGRNPPSNRENKVGMFFFWCFFFLGFERRRSITRVLPGRDRLAGGLRSALPFCDMESDTWSDRYNTTGRISNKESSENRRGRGPTLHGHFGLYDNAVQLVSARLYGTWWCLFVRDYRKRPNGWFLLLPIDSIDRRYQLKMMMSMPSTVVPT